MPFHQVCLGLVPRIGGAQVREDRLDFVVLPFRCSFQHGLHGIPVGQVGARTWLKGKCFTEFKDVNWFEIVLTISEVMLKVISIWENLKFDLGYDLNQLYFISWVEGSVTCKVWIFTVKVYEFSQSRCSGLEVRSSVLCPEIFP